MKKKNVNSLHPIVENLNKIVVDKHLSKSAFADLVGFTESKWNKISNGEQKLQLDELSKIAERIGFSICDIVVYPQKIKVVDSDEVNYDRVSVTFEVSAENRDTLIRMVNNHQKK